METALEKFVLDGVTLAIEQATFLGDLVITTKTRLVDDLRLGWFGVLKLAYFLEKNFDIELSDEALNRFVTVGDIVKHLSRNYFQDAVVGALQMA